MSFAFFSQHRGAPVPSVRPPGAPVALLALALLPVPAAALNGCLDANFIDWRGEALVQIANDDPTNPFRYRPRCATISEGTAIRFQAVPNFGMHPLFGGTVSAGQAHIDPASPIGSITSGKQAERTIFGLGEFPYFCDFHFDQGMMGSIRVVPELFADGFD
jgi:plastocyanin